MTGGMLKMEQHNNEIIPRHTTLPFVVIHTDGRRNGDNGQRKECNGKYWPIMQLADGQYGSFFVTCTFNDRFRENGDLSGNTTP